MNKTLGLLSAFVGMSTMFNDFSYPWHSPIKPLTEGELRRLREENKRKLIAINEKKGVKEFIIDGKKVYAINYKNALRKVKNQMV